MAAHDVQVRSANACVEHLDDGVGGVLDLGLWSVDGLDGANFFEDDGFHLRWVF